MKNNLLTTLAIGCASFTFGQYAPNGGFESWTEIPTYQVPDTDPADFLSSSAETFVIDGVGNVTEESGPVGSGSSIKLETKEYDGDATAAFGIIGGFPGDDDLVFSGGFPMTDKSVQGISFSFKSDVALGDTALLLIQFKKDGMAVSDANVTGDIPLYLIPFTRANNALLWKDTTANLFGMLPDIDTCVIAFASSNVLNEDQDPRVGSILMLDNLEFSGSDVEIPGGDFETWVDAPSRSYPNDWDFEGSDIFGEDITRLTDDDAFEGNSAVMIESDESGDAVYLTLGQSDDLNAIPGMALTGNPQDLKFHYIYETGDNAMDAGEVYYILSSWNSMTESRTEVYSAGMLLSEVSDWTEVVIDLSAHTGADSIYIEFSSTDYNNNGAGSALSIDDIYITSDVNTAPSVSMITPENLVELTIGTEITISATVTDLDDNLVSVTGTVGQLPSGASQAITLTDSDDDGVYEGTWTVTGNDGENWGVNVVATDDDGESGSDGVVFTVHDAPTGLFTSNANPGISLIPNPAVNNLEVVVASDITRVDVVSAQGIIVLTSDEASINIQDLKSGMYSIVVYTEEGTHSDKLIKR